MPLTAEEQAEVNGLKRSCAGYRSHYTHQRNLLANLFEQDESTINPRELEVVFEKLKDAYKGESDKTNDILV